MQELRCGDRLAGGEVAQGVGGGDGDGTAERAESRHADHPVRHLDVDLDNVAAGGVPLRGRGRWRYDIPDPAGVVEAVEKLCAVHGLPA
jgi:hypothetical protein